MRKGAVVAPVERGLLWPLEKGAVVAPRKSGLWWPLEKGGCVGPWRKGLWWWPLKKGVCGCPWRKGSVVAGVVLEERQSWRDYWRDHVFRPRPGE